MKLEIRNYLKHLNSKKPYLWLIIVSITISVQQIFFTEVLKYSEEEKNECFKKEYLDKNRIKCNYLMHTNIHYVISAFLTSLIINIIFFTLYGYLVTI